MRPFLRDVWYDICYSRPEQKTSSVNVMKAESAERKKENKKLDCFYLGQCSLGVGWQVLMCPTQCTYRKDREIGKVHCGSACIVVTGPFAQLWCCVCRSVVHRCMPEFGLSARVSPSEVPAWGKHTRFSIDAPSI